VIQRPPRAALAGAVAAAALGLAWIALADAVVDRSGAPTGLDDAVLAVMMDHRSPVLTAVLLVITSMGGTLGMTVATFLTAAWLAWHRAWPHAVLIVVAGAGAAVLVPLTKNLIGRARPPPADQLVVLTNQAFPSGHALGSLTVIGAITAVALTRLRTRRARVTATVAAAVFVVSVGVSRLYLGVHWATDVLGGWLLGGAWLGLCLTAYYLLTAAPRDGLGPASPPG
jgi:undecaprenyl-diphosphatase